MKIVKQGITEIYDYTCEEIIEETCPVCKAVFNSCGHIIQAFIIRVVVMAAF